MPPTTITIPTVTCAKCKNEAPVQPRSLTKATALVQPTPGQVAHGDDGSAWAVQGASPDGWQQTPVGLLCGTCNAAWNKSLETFLSSGDAPGETKPLPPNVQPISRVAPVSNVRPNSIVAQQGVQTGRTMGVVRGAPAVSSPPQPAAAGGQRVTVQQTHRAVAGAVATLRSAAPTPPPTSSALQAPAPSAQARVIGGAAHSAARAELMAPGSVPPTALRVSAPSPIAPPQRQFSQLPESAPATHSAKTEIVSIEPLPPKPEAEDVPSDDELVAALASENAKQEVA